MIKSIKYIYIFWRYYSGSLLSSFYSLNCLLLYSPTVKLSSCLFLSSSWQFALFLSCVVLALISWLLVFRFLPIFPWFGSAHPLPSISYPCSLLAHPATNPLLRQLFYNICEGFSSPDISPCWIDRTLLCVSTVPSTIVWSILTIEFLLYVSGTVFNSRDTRFIALHRCSGRYIRILWFSLRGSTVP